MGVEFFVTALIVVATPGTGAIYTMAAGLSRGARASLVAAFGCTLGIVPHMLAAITGLAALLHTSAVAFQTLKYLGVAYLLYMAWGMLRDKGALTVEESSAASSSTQVIISAVLINLLNPKLTVFFFAFLPQFVNTGGSGSLVSMIQMSGLFMVMTFVVFAIYGRAASGMRTYVLNRPRVLTWMRRAFAGSFALLGARLAFADTK